VRGRHASAGARLLLILLLATGTVISGLQPSEHVRATGDSADSVPAGTALAAKTGDADDTDTITIKNDDNQNAHNKNGRHKKNKNGDKRKGKHSGKKQDRRDDEKNTQKQRVTEPAPAALDAESIAAENAATVEALDCGDLIAIHVGDRTYCTHGEDPPMAAPGAAVEDGDGGVGIESVEEPAPPALCLDNGVSGPRIQIVYVRRSDRPSRLPELLPVFRRLAAEMDIIFDQSAGKTGGTLRPRFVTNGNCQVDVPELAVPPRTLDGFGSLIQKMDEAGFGALDRKYLMLVDERMFCGIGTFNGGNGADSPNTAAHNFTGYARVDTPCWDAGSMAHEISHTMGGVQYSAPHTSGGAHCIDEWDVMCYSDQPFRPKMEFRCPAGSEDFRLDCNNDDYFSAHPAPGSYLATHWNMADSIYLTSNDEETCVDAAFEPDDAYWYDFWKAPMRGFTIGTDESHAFCKEPGDVDWVPFQAHGGASYLVETNDLGADVDTQLVLYRGFVEEGWEEMDLVTSSDNRADGDFSSAITFTAPVNGSYLVGVSEVSNRAGLDKTYSLRITEVPTTGTGSLSLSRTKARPGGAFTATMFGLVPQSWVIFWWQLDGQVRRLGDAAADGNGVASAVFNVPREATPGIYQVEGMASDTSVASVSMKTVNPRHGKGKNKGKNRSQSKGNGKSKKKHGKGNGKGKGKHGNGQRNHGGRGTQ
jgi:hypothetical protein